MPQIERRGPVRPGDSSPAQRGTGTVEDGGEGRCWWREAPSAMLRSTSLARMVPLSPAFAEGGVDRGSGPDGRERRDVVGDGVGSLLDLDRGAATHAVAGQADGDGGADVE